MVSVKVVLIRSGNVVRIHGSGSTNHRLVAGILSIHSSSGKTSLAGLGLEDLLGLLVIGEGAAWTVAHDSS